MSEEHTTSTTIRLDQDDRRILVQLSKIERLPQSEVIRRAIRELGAARGLSERGELEKASA